MKVLLLTQYFTPEPVEKFADLARGLVQRGHEVEVLTGFPCYPQGRTYAGFRQRLCQREEVDGYKVIRVPQVADHSTSVLRRALYYISFALSAATIGLVKICKSDVVVVYQSALPIGLAAWFISRVRRIPYVLDVVDLWPESVSASGMLTNRWAVGLIRWCMRFVYRGAARISVITMGYRDNLVRLGVPAEKIDLIHYWVAEGKYDQMERDDQCAEQFGMTGRFNLVYAGAMGPCQQLQTVLDAAKLLQDLSDVQILLIGDGVETESLKSHAKRSNLTNVRFLGRLPAGEVARVNACADLLLVHLKPDPMSEVSIPSKTFACMASGRPLLMAVRGEASRLVESYKCGIVAPPSQPEKLADAIRGFRLRSPQEQQRMGEAARKAYLQNFSSPVQIAKFETLLKRVVVKRTSASGEESFYRRYGKRVFDFSVALSALVLLSPVLLIVAGLVRFKLGRPIFFRQARPGLQGKLFELIKFRSMRDASDPEGIQLPDEKRLTRFGKFLRASSLDELPELWSILKGEMSLVGPRPLLAEYLPMYSTDQARRHDVLPGLTGWSQIHGRNDLSWEEKFTHDLWYVNNCSFLIDLRILARTVGKVFTRQGVNQSGHVTTQKFSVSKSLDTSDGVLVLGAGGQAKVVISTMQAAGHKISGVYDDASQLIGTEILGCKVMGRIIDLPMDSVAPAIIAIGDNDTRRAIAKQFSFRWMTLVHPRSWVDPAVKLGEGTVVMAGAVVQPGCNIGCHAIINTAASIDHDCELGAFIHICPGTHLAGMVNVGDGTVVGTGSVALPKIQIGADSIIGAGTVVTKDIPDGVTAVGQPARIIKVNHHAQRAA